MVLVSLENPFTGTAFRVEGGDLTLDNTSATQSRLLVGTGETDEYNYEGIRIAGTGKATVKAKVSIETGPSGVYIWQWNTGQRSA